LGYEAHYKFNAYFLRIPLTESIVVLSVPQVKIDGEIKLRDLEEMIDAVETPSITDNLIRLCSKLASFGRRKKC